MKYLTLNSTALLLCFITINISVAQELDIAQASFFHFNELKSAAYPELELRFKAYDPSNFNGDSLILSLESKKHQALNIKNVTRTVGHRMLESYLLMVGVKGSDSIEVFKNLFKLSKEELKYPVRLIYFKDEQLAVADHDFAKEAGLTKGLLKMNLLNKKTSYATDMLNHQKLVLQLLNNPENQPKLPIYIVDTLIHIENKNVQNLILNGPDCGILVMNKTRYDERTLLPEKIKKKVIFVDYYNDEFKSEDILVRLDPFINHQYEVKMDLVPDNYPITNDSLILTIGNSASPFVRDVGVVFLQSAVNNYHKKRVQARIALYKEIKQYDSAVLLLDNYYGQTFDQEAATVATKMLTTALNEKITTNTPNSIFEYLQIEDLWSHLFDSTFEQKRDSLILAYSYQLEKAGGNFNQRKQAFHYLKDKYPSNSSYQFSYHLAIAGDFRSQGKTWQAIGEYGKSLTIKKSPYIEKIQYEILEKTIQENYKNKSYSIICSKGKEYEPLIEQDFTLRAMYANSCYHSKDYNSALKHFNWLAFNWEEQELVSWEETLLNIKDLNATLLNFEIAKEMTIRLYRIDGEREHLISTLAFSRAIMIEPLLIAMNTYDHGSDITNLSFKPISALVFPEYIQSIKLIEENKVVKTLYQSIDTNETINTENFQLEKYGFYSSGDLHHLISKMKDGNHLVITLNNEMDLNERNILIEIEKRQDDDRYWRQLDKYQEERTLPFFTKALSKIIESEVNLGHISSLENYWQALNEKSNLLYIARYDSDSLQEQCNYFPNKGAYVQADYQKSTKTMAYYKQEINYEDKKVYDLSNPLFNAQKTWQGVIRIGIIPI